MDLFNIIAHDTVLGKLLVIILIIVASHYHILFGITIFLFFISLTQYNIEGMENKDSKVSKDSNDSNECMSLL